MEKEERLELLRQERITRSLTAHIVDKLYEDSLSIFFDCENDLIKETKTDKEYRNIYDEIDVSDGIFSNEDFINIVIKSYGECQAEVDEESYYMPPDLYEEILMKVNEEYDEALINMATDEIDERWKAEGRQEEIGCEEYMEELDDEYEMMCECVYGYETVDIENRVCSVLDNLGLVYTMEIYSKTPIGTTLSYQGIVNSSKRLLFEPISVDRETYLGGSITPAPKYEGGNINVPEDLERGYINIIRASVEF